MTMMNEKPDIETAEPCPFRGWHELHITDWWDEDGEYYAIECRKCKAAAPADVWNKRASAEGPSWQEKLAADDSHNLELAL